jgi:acetyl esterase/lipase
MKKYDFVCISVEYRLAPENPNPIPLDECYAGLEWVGENVSSLGINPNKLMIYGPSAGGGLAAGTALLARDRRGPHLCAQLLVYPMLDDRNVTISSQQYDDEGSWSKKSNIAVWRWYLGDDDGERSIYAAPARATDLSGLPQTYIDVGSADVFRDENVAYATRLWEFGVQAELHVWPGCIHGFDEWVPEHLISKGAKEARTGWIGRVLGVEPKPL